MYIKTMFSYNDAGKNMFGNTKQMPYSVHVMVWYVQGYENVFVWKSNRFKKRMKKWYNFTDKDADEKWQEAVRDPQVPKGTDQWLDYNRFSLKLTLEFCQASKFANPDIHQSCFR